jgi:CheY-like chemotaxis protein
MPPTILHVEDDTALAEIVEMSFEGFGFRGTTLHAETVAQAESILDDVARRDGTIDLIISDMSLPDGTGLDLVRDVRRNPVWEHTPLLILSGNADPTVVGRAYALGANCYVAKAPRGRSIVDVVKCLYDHWLRDVQLPAAADTDRTNQFLGRAVKLRGRHAAFYTRMAEQFGDTESEAAFWLTRTLGESNLGNLIAFLRRQFAGHALPAELLDDIEQVQADATRALDAIELAIELQPIITRDDAYHRMLELISLRNVRSFVLVLGYLFPVQPVATAALIDFVAGDLDEVAGWLETHATDAATRGDAAKLHADARFLRRLSWG